MKIKIFAMTVVLSIALGMSVHAIGIGAQLNFSAGEIFAPGAAVAISPSNTTHLAFNWYFAKDTNIIGLTADIHPLVLPITNFSAGTFNFTLGIGLFANVVFTDDPGINGGLRLPVGFNVMLGRNAFEIYTHIAPSFGVNFLPSLGFSNPFFPMALGARFWF